MPDIMLCPGEDCPRKWECYKYTAKPSDDHQAYFEKPPIKEGVCAHFWATNETSE
jgi:hypothetical protein